MTNAAELLKELVSINSVNPDLVTGAAGEVEIAAFCAQWLSERMALRCIASRNAKGAPPLSASPRVGAAAAR